MRFGANPQKYQTLVPANNSHLKVCLLVEAQNPNIISIVESWLCTDIPDIEICIPGYQLFRKDCSRHGVGVLLYIREIFTARVLPSNLVNNLEILPIVVYHLDCKFCITTFYRPPNSPSSIFDTLFSFLMSLNVPTFLSFVLLGDFNMANQSHLLYHKVCSLLDYFRFLQIVTDYTHTTPNGSNSRIDLVLTMYMSPSQVFRCATIPPLDNPTAKSYHLGLCLNIASWYTREPFSQAKSQALCTYRFRKSFKDDI